MYINHITLTTGHIARTSRADVADATLAVLVPWLLDVVAKPGHHPLPVPALSHYSMQAIYYGAGFLATIYGPRGPHTPGKPHAGDTIPLVTLGIAQRSRHGADLWALMVDDFPVAEGAQRPSEPWCAVALHDGLAAHREAAMWLGDLERCIAWAWITRNPQLGEAQ